MDDDNFQIPCYEEDLESMPAEELDNYYSILEKGGILELNWKCVGEWTFINIEEPKFMFFEF